ncbi:MAG: helix-turn-helix domain-containing protein [Treponema sp.]|nr:helix-turn-helix domain-containing protein [Treponema sp.]
MTSLRSVLAFNMKEQRHVLGLTQAKLAERVNTSTHYIGMIESEKKFPTPEMLERIAAALEIDAPALFSTKSYPSPEAGTMGKFQERIMTDISQVITCRVRELGRETVKVFDLEDLKDRKIVMRKRSPNAPGRLFDEHRVPVTEEPVPLVHRIPVRLQDKSPPRKG